jgi:D-serine deaminase-like pyridoxal phosphate-dependent protein
MPIYLTDLETPVPLVDLDRLAANLDRMAAYCALHGLALRPHVKTHKSPRLAAEQLRLGAVGLTCATLRELEVMADVSHDLLWAYPPVGSPRLRRLFNLPRDAALTVALDSLEALEALADLAEAADREVGVYIEVDVGMRRVGVTEPEEAVLLASRARALSPLRYRGICFYPGHIREPLPRQDEAIERLGRDLERFVRALDAAGMPPQVVSGGSTPAAWRMHEVPFLTEVRPGTYVYNDRATVLAEACGWEDCALTVLATVVSTAVPGQAVVDAGSKALGREPLLSGVDSGFACVLDHPEVSVVRMSEEHGVLDLRGSDWRPKVGDLVRLVPNHVCVTVHLNDYVYGVRGQVVEAAWWVAARGRGDPLLTPQ